MRTDPTYRRLARTFELPDGNRRIYCYHVRKTAGTSLYLSFMALGGEDPMDVWRRITTSRLPRTVSGGYSFVSNSRRLLAEGAYFYGRSHRAAADQPLPPRTFTVTVLRDPVQRVHSYFDYLVAGDEAGAVAVCHEALAGWATPVDLHLALMVPALRSIGHRWETGELTVAAEHRASAVATRVMGRFGPSFVRPGRRRGTVVVAAPSGDHHALPVMVVGDLLRDAGYAVVDLGPDTPARSLVDAARSADRLVGVAIGASITGLEEAVREAVAALHDGMPGVPVIVGGAGIPAEVARQAGADRWSGPDGPTLVELVEALGDRVGGPDGPG